MLSASRSFPRPRKRLAHPSCVLVTLLACIAGPMVCAPARASESDPWFAQDKYLHGGVSAGLTLGGYAAASLFLEEPKWRLMSGAGLALAAGITKEVVDLCGPGDASWRDMTWDVMGVATGALVAWLVDTYVFR